MWGFLLKNSLLKQELCNTLCAVMLCAFMLLGHYCNCRSLHKLRVGCGIVSLSTSVLFQFI